MNYCAECGNTNYHNRGCSSSNYEQTGADTNVRKSEQKSINPLEGATLVNIETLPDGSQPIKLSRSIRVF